MITRLTPTPNHPAASPLELLPEKTVPETDRGAGRLALQAVLAQTANATVPLDSNAGSLDHHFYWQRLMLERGTAPLRIAGAILRLPQAPDASYTTTLHRLDAPEFAGAGQAAGRIRAGVSFNRDLRRETSPFGLNLTYTLSEPGDVRLHGSAYNIQPHTPEADLLARLALPELAEFGPKVGVSFTDTPVGERQITRLSELLGQPVPLATA